MLNWIIRIGRIPRITNLNERKSLKIPRVKIRERVLLLEKGGQGKTRGEGGPFARGDHGARWDRFQHKPLHLR